MGLTVGDVQVKASLDKSDLTRGLSSAKGEVESFASGVEGRMSKMGGAIGSAMKTGIAAATVALAGVATVGVKTYMDIESAAADAASKMDLSAIAQKSGTSMEQAFKGVKEHVMALSDELGQLNTNAFDPTQIAQACANLAAGGFDVATASAKDLAPILALATATNYDLGKSAELATSTMGIFGKSVNDLGNISDVLTQACGDSKMGMEDLNYAIQAVGPTAASFGVDFETMTANLESFSQKGIKGEKAGTALRDAINTLGAPSGSAAKALGALGFSVASVDPKTKDLNASLGALKEAADRSGRGVSAFVDIFGVQGGLLYSLAEANTQTAEFKSKLLDCNGAAEQMARLMLDNLKGSFDAAFGAASSLAYLIGSKLAPTLKSVFDWFSSTGAPAIRAFIEALSSGDWDKVGSMMKSGFEAGVNAAKDLLGRLGSFILSLPWASWATTAGGYIVSGITAGIQALQSIGKTIAGWIESQGGWSALGTKIANLIKGAWASFTGWANPILDSLRNSFTTWASGSEPSSWGKTLGKGLVDGIKASLGTPSTWIAWAAAGLEAGGKFASSFVGELLAAIADSFGDALMSAISGALRAIAGTMDDTILGGISNPFKKWALDTANSADAAKVTPRSANRYGSGGNSGNPGSYGGYGGYSSGSSNPDDLVKALNKYTNSEGERVFDVSDDTIKKAIDAIESGNGQKPTGLDANTWKDLIQRLKMMGVTRKEDAKTQVDAAKEAAKITTDAAKDAAKTMKDGTKSAYDSAKSTLDKVITEGRGLAQSLLEASLSTKDAGQSVANALTSASQNALTIGNQVSSAFKGAGDAVKIGLDSAGRQIAVIGSVAQNQFAAAGGQFVGAVVGGANSARGVTVGAAQQASSLIQGVTAGFSGSVNSATGGLQAGANSLYGAASAVNGAAAKLNSSGGVGNVPYGPYQPGKAPSGSSSGKGSDFFSQLGFSDLSGWGSGYHPTPTYASGKATSGPELAVIGEDGQEFVIPTKKKRWDLLLAAMQAYGIKGMAEGGSAGASVGNAPTDADAMTATFGIKGLASMSKQVQKILNDLKDFFRLTWSIIKSEGQVYWRQINTTLDIEITALRDNAWTALIGIKNTGIQSFRDLVDSGKTIMAEMWPGIEPTMTSVHDGIVNSFTDASSQISSILMTVNSDAMNSLQNFATNWSGVWQQLLSDLQSTASQISSFIQGIASQLSNISVNISMGGGGGGYGGGDYGGGGSSPDMSGMGGGQQGGPIINPNGSANFIDTDCFGSPILVNALKYTNPSGVVNYINPLNFIDNGGISGYQGSSSNAGRSSSGVSGGGGGGAFGPGGVFAPGWDMSSPWAAEGAVIDKPSMVHVAERGPELILPTNLTRMFLDMVGAGPGGGAGDRIVIENHLFLDGRDVTDSIMNKAVSMIRNRGGKPTF